MGYHQGLQIVSFMQNYMISLYYETRMKLYMFNESLSSWANCIKSKQEEKRSLPQNPKNPYVWCIIDQFMHYKPNFIQ